MHQLADGANALGSKIHDSYFNNALQEFLDGVIDFKEKEAGESK
jgi:DNA-directed RNA polymerase subunit K/omega